MPFQAEDSPRRMTSRSPLSFCRRDSSRSSSSPVVAACFLQREDESVDQSHLGQQHEGWNFPVDFGGDIMQERQRVPVVVVLGSQEILGLFQHLPASAFHPPQFVIERWPLARLPLEGVGSYKRFGSNFRLPDVVERRGRYAKRLHQFLPEVALQVMFGPSRAAVARMMVFQQAPAVVGQAAAMSSGIAGDQRRHRRSVFARS